MAVKKYKDVDEKYVCIVDGFYDIEGAEVFSSIKDAVDYIDNDLHRADGNDIYIYKLTPVKRLTMRYANEDV